MAKLNPYLTFNGNCSDAMNFYNQILKGKLDILKVVDSPIKDQMPEQFHDKVLHSTLKTDDFEFMATDMVQGGFHEGNTVHLCLVCKSEPEIRGFFVSLSAGGRVNQPLNEMFFGLIGSLTDKFGKSWVLEMDKQ